MNLFKKQQSKPSAKSDSPPRKRSRKDALKRRAEELRIRRSAELWLDLFMSSIDSAVSEDPNTHLVSGAPIIRLVDNAHELADVALACYQERWPGVKLP